LEFHRPKTVRDVTAFLGLSGYYTPFIKDNVAVSGPLTQLTKKDAKFEWTEAQQAALRSDSVLGHPRFDLFFILSCDASNYATCAELERKDHEVLEEIYNKINYIRQHSIYLYIRLHVSTHQSVIFRPT